MPAMTRRGLVCAGIAAGLAGGEMAMTIARAGPASARDAARQRLAAVRAWGCQYVNIDPAAIAASGLDLVVVEPVIDSADGRVAPRRVVERMRSRPGGGQRLVLAYLSVGAAESYRNYWRSEWLADPPDWLGPESADWPRSYAVRYWHQDWKALVERHLEDIVAAGFDGVFLDRVDAFGDWRGERPGGEDDMVALVEALLARARAQAPGFLAVAQNAEQLLARAAHRRVIDGVSKESLLTGLRGEGRANRPEDVAWSLALIDQARRDAITILAIEYLGEPAMIAVARTRLDALGIVPFFARRNLDRLPAP